MARLPRVTLNFTLVVFLLLTGIFLFANSQKASASNPNLINFQGKVTNANGTNVTDGTYNFSFVLFDDATLGSESDGHDKWHELSKSVVVTNGIFQTELGSATALPDFSANSALYLAVKFNGDATGTNGGYMLPRVHLDSVPYALNSDKLGGLTSSGYIQNNTSQQTSSNFNISGNGTIGTNLAVGGTATFQNTANSASAFQIQNAASTTLFSANTSSSQISIANAGSSYSNEFTSSLTGWSLLNTSSETLSDGGSTGTIVSNKLRISPNTTGATRDCFGATVTCLREVEAGPGTEDFQIETKMDTPPATSSNGQAFGLFIYQDSTNFFRYEWSNVGTTNYTARIHKTINGTGTSDLQTVNNATCTMPSSAPLYLRINRTGHYWVFSYSTDGITFTNCTTVRITQTDGTTLFNAAKVGVDVSNGVGLTLPSTIDFDYFRLDVSNLKAGNVSIQLASPNASSTNSQTALTIKDNLGSPLLIADTAGYNLTVGGTPIDGAVNTFAVRNTSSIFKPSANSVTTFQVQNSAGNNYLLVDTSTAAVSVGNTGIASTVQIGNTTGTGITQTINIGNNTASTSVNNVNIGSTIGGTTAITGPTTVTNRTSGSSDTFVVGNSTSTGTIAKFQDNSSVVFSLADGGNALFQPATNSTTAFQIQNTNSNAVFLVDSTNNNTITNSSFETGSTGWSIMGTATITAPDATNRLIGNNAIKVHNVAASNEGIQTSATSILASSTAYALSMYVYVTGLVTAQMGYSINGGAPTACASTGTTSRWVRLSCSIPSTGGITSSYVYIRNTSGIGGGADFWVDGVMLEAAGNTSAFYREGNIQLNGRINSPVTISGDGPMFSLQKAAGGNSLAFDTGNNHLTIYENLASPTNYIDIYYDNATSTAKITASAGTVEIGGASGPITLSAGASDAVNITAQATSVWQTTTGNLTIDATAASASVLFGTGAAAKTIQVGTTSTNTGNTQTIGVGSLNAAGTTNVTVGTGSSATAGSTTIQAKTNVDIQVATSGTINVGDTAITQTIDIGGVTNSGTDTVNIATNATAADVVVIGSTHASSTLNLEAGTGASAILIGNGTTAHGIQIGAGGAAAGNAQNVTIGSLSTTTNSKILLQGGSIANSSGVAGVFIGSPTANAELVTLQLDSDSDITADENNGTNCTTTINQGAMYYNTATNAIRACINATWEDLASTGGLGIMLFGVVADSGAAPGDVAGAVANVNGNGNVGPCKVSYSSATAIAINACTAFSGGRKVIVAATTLNLSTAGGGAGVAINAYANVCLGSSGASGTPVILAANGTETTATVPTFSATSPVLCLATIRANGTLNNLGNIWDTRTFINTSKQFASCNSVHSPGYAMQGSAGSVNTAVTGAAVASMRGVVVAANTGGAASNTAINCILATNGLAFAKSLAGATSAINSFVQNAGTAGYVLTAAVTATGYGNLGLSLRTIDTACSLVTNCQYSQLVSLSLR